MQTETATEKEITARLDSGLCLRVETGIGEQSPRLARRADRGTRRAYSLSVGRAQLPRHHIVTAHERRTYHGKRRELRQRPRLSESLATDASRDEQSLFQRNRRLRA